MAVIAVAAGPAVAQETIRPGQTVRGELTASDPLSSDGKRYDCFQVQTQRGQTLQVDLLSSAFDSFVSVGTGGCGSMTVTANDDDSGDGLNARVTLEGTGNVVTIRANSIIPGQTGSYQLTVSQPGQAMTTSNGYEGVDTGTLGTARPTTLPRVTSESGTGLAQCLGAYGAIVEMNRAGTSVRDYGNVASIDYLERFRTLAGRLRPNDPVANAVELFAMTFKSSALAGAIGLDPNGQPNGGRPLAEYLTALGNCDREWSFTPVTAY
ncbi:MAG: hypothetical protein KJ824_16635 [Alphaproteobacteria bacterium]|nr:hypothetical protein [Alphaproteobacteria bacterium]